VFGPASVVGGVPASSRGLLGSVGTLISPLPVPLHDQITAAETSTAPVAQRQTVIKAP
jgi:hypothetical protein